MKARSVQAAEVRLLQPSLRGCVCFGEVVGLEATPRLLQLVLIDLRVWIELFRGGYLGSALCWSG